MPKILFAVLPLITIYGSLVRFPFAECTTDKRKAEPPSGNPARYTVHPGNPAALSRPVAFRPYLAVSVAFAWIIVIKLILVSSISDSE